jgi:hypothetical protein
MSTVEPEIKTCYFRKVLLNDKVSYLYLFIFMYLYLEFGLTYINFHIKVPLT